MKARKSKLFKVVGVCYWEGCGEGATVFAAGRYDRSYVSNGHGIGQWCALHASQVLNEGGPEYETDCPYCGCQFGVN